MRATAPFASRLPDHRIADSADPGLALIALDQGQLPLVAGWLAQPHVAEWWGDRDVEMRHITAHLTSDFVAPFVAVADNRPIGYLQIYHANRDEFWTDCALPRETFGVDLSIGEPDAIGHGFGPGILALAIRRLFAWPEVCRIHIDPDPTNDRAIRANEKAGFRRIGPIDTPDGPALYMQIERTDTW